MVKKFFSFGKWMQQRADVVCNFCQGKIFLRNYKLKQLCSRSVECDYIILDNFNYCECCNLETARQLRITKARELSNFFPKSHATPFSPQKEQKSLSVKSLAASTITSDKSQDLFDDFQVDDEKLKQLEKSLLFVSSEEEDKDNKFKNLEESLVTEVSSEEENKENK